MRETEECWGGTNEQTHQRRILAPETGEELMEKALEVESDSQAEIEGWALVQEWEAVSTKAS